MKSLVLIILMGLALPQSSSLKPTGSQVIALTSAESSSLVRAKAEVEDLYTRYRNAIDGYANISRGVVKAHGLREKDAPGLGGVFFYTGGPPPVEYTYDYKYLVIR